MFDKIQMILLMKTSIWTYRDWTSKNIHIKIEFQNSIVSFEFFVPCNEHQNCLDKYLILVNYYVSSKQSFHKYLSSECLPPYSL